MRSVNQMHAESIKAAAGHKPKRRSTLLPLIGLIFVNACTTTEAVVVDAGGDVSQGGKPIVTGQQLSGDEDLVVGKGWAVVDIEDVGQVRLYSQTRMRLGSRDGSSIKLLAGKLWAVISAKRFEVETENAVAGVRGTEFVVDKASETTEVRVMEGEVELASKESRKTQSLRGGQRSRVKGSGSPSSPQKYDPEGDRALWRKIKTFFKSLGRAIKKGVKEIGKATQQERKEVGDAAKDVAQEVGKGAKDVAKEVEKGAKDVGRSIKKGLKGLLDDDDNK